MPEPVLFDVPMSDGVRISAIRYPAPSSPAPTVVMMTPYHKEAGAGQNPLLGLIHQAGYHFVVGDTRGFGGSLSPTYDGLLNERELQDGVEFLEWVAKADFCDGQTAIVGASYMAINQLQFAARRPAGLKCIVPMVSPVDTFRDFTNRGGIPSHAVWGGMTYAGSGQENTMRVGLAQYSDLLGRPDDDDHVARSPDYVLDRIDVPTLCIGGWYDYFLRGTLRVFRTVDVPKRLVVGPWGHGDFGETHTTEILRWLDYWLKGEGADPSKGDNVVLWQAGTEEWLTFPSFPESDEPAWGTVQPVTEPTPTTALLHIGAAPPHMPTVSFMTLMPDIATGSGNRIWGEQTKIDGPVLDEPTFLLGHVGVTLALRTDECRDLDAYVRLSAVHEDGSVLPISEGKLRASYRTVDESRSVLTPDGDVVIPWHPHREQEAVPAGESITLAVEMESVCAQLQAGDRLRLGVSLVRHDEAALPGEAVLLPETRVLLPVKAG